MKKQRNIGMKRSTIIWPRAGKYNVVTRALPYPDRGEKGCKWFRTTTPKGRVILEPVR